LVVVDTAIWIDYFKNARSDQVAELVELIDDGRAAYVGVVLAELLRGRRSQEERELLERQLVGASFVEMTKAAWRRASVVSAELESSGQRIPMTDVFIAALVLEGGHELLTRDRHFERIPRLRFYQPDGSA
jgi:predicted nucleic acid-binding protein